MAASPSLLEVNHGKNNRHIDAAFVSLSQRLLVLDAAGFVEQCVNQQHLVFSASKVNKGPGHEDMNFDIKQPMDSLRLVLSDRVVDC